MRIMPLFLTFTALVVFSFGLMSCSSKIEDYAASSPRFALEEYFTGQLSAHGIVQDRAGKVLRRFSVDMRGTWQGSKGTLEEDFLYDDGEKQRRVWHIEKTAAGHYTGTADDVVVPAKGQTQGFALNWRYTLAVPVAGKVWNIAFNDWMYQLDEKRVINRAQMSKLGVKVGEVTLWIERKD